MKNYIDYYQNSLIHQAHAYAKVNLGLNVYHLNQKYHKHKIKSIMMICHELYDEIMIYEHHCFQVQYFDQSTNEIHITDDIITKVVNYFKEHFKITFNYLIIVKKNIPFKSGLGGSSTDGASVAKFIINHFHLKLTKKDYLKLAITISSDLIFFIFDYELALVSQYGNKVKKINSKLKPQIKLLLNQETCDTKLIYEQFDLIQNVFYQRNKFKMIIRNLPCLDNINLINNLEPIALKIYPHLNDLKTSDTILSGSGSSFIKYKNW